MSSISKIFNENADASLEENHQPITLDSIENVYYVDKGIVDIYITRKSHDKIEGPLYHLATISSDNIILPVISADGPSEIVILFRIARGATVLSISVDTFNRIAKSLPDEMSLLIKNWVEMFSKCAMLGRMPITTQLLEANSLIQLICDGSIGVAHSLYWVQAKDQIGVFLSDMSIEFREDTDYFPISQYGWIDFKKDTLLKTIETKQIINNGIIFDNVIRFNSIVLQILAVKNVINQELFYSLKKHEKLKQEKMDIQYAELALSKVTNPDSIVDGYEINKNRVMQQFAYVASYAGCAINSLRMSEAKLSYEEKMHILFYRSRIAYRKVHFSNSWYQRDNGSLLGFKKDTKEPVAFFSADGTNNYYYDAADNKKHKVTKKNASNFLNYGYEIYLSLLRKKRDQESILIKLFRLVKFDIRWTLFLSLVISLIGLLPPLLSSFLIDRVIPYHDIKQFYWIIATIIMGILISYLLAFTRGYTISRIRNKLGYEVQVSLWDRLFRLPISFVNRYTSGDLSWRMSAADRVQTLLSVGAVEILLNSLFALINLIFLFYLSFTLALISALFISLYLLLIYKLSLKIIRMQRSAHEQQSQLTGIMNQIIKGIVKIRSMSSEARAFNYWAKPYVEFRKKTYHIIKTENLLKVIMESVPYFSILLIFIAIASINNNYQISAGDFVAFYMIYIALFISISNLSSVILNLSDAYTHFEGIQDVLLSALERPPHASETWEIQGNIEALRLIFSYPDSVKNIINSFSLKINSGEFIGIVGPSGAGKSTLIKLLINFHKPLSGHIFIDGKDLINLDAEIMRKKIGIVLQDDQLLPDSIYKNIVGNEEVSQEAIDAVVSMVGLDKDLYKMPMGVHTVVNIGGSGLSHGQKQKILIARALIAKPNVIILDEALSAMDYLSQNTIINALRSMNITRIMVTHRVSCVKYTDRIIVMNKGKIVEEGTYKNLIGREGLFYKLFAEQNPSI